MNYNITGAEIKITDELRTYVEKRLHHVDKFVGNDSTALVDVKLHFQPLNDGGKYCAELTLSVGGEVYRAEAWGSTMHEAIDVSAGELTHELSRVKAKRLHVLRHSAVRVKEFLRGWRKKV